MQLQFHKTLIPYLQTIKREQQTQEQTQEVRITDDMPDIGRVLACWGQIVIRSKEWRNGSAGISGGVMAWVLYAPEDDSEPQSVETWIPFQMKWEFPEHQRDGSVLVMPLLRGVDARSVSARKLMIRAGISVIGKILLPAEAEVTAPTNIPEDVQILKNTYPLQIPKETGEKAFSLDETLSLPSGVPGLKKLIRYHLHPKMVEDKVIGDKLVIRGAALLNILYMGVDDHLHNHQFELPFSQYADLDREYGADANTQIQFAVTALELEQAEEENLSLKAGITAQYVIWERSMIDVVEDMYSPHRKINLELGSLQLPALLSESVETIPVEHSVETEGMQVVDATFYPDHPKLNYSEDMLDAELAGVVQLLGYQQDGTLSCVAYNWQKDWPIHGDNSVQLELSVYPMGRTQAVASGAAINIQDELQLMIQAFNPVGIPMTAGAELADMTEPDPERPSLILRRAGDDTLWAIAKETGSTVESIRKANGLQYEPEANQMLLIPIP